MHRHLSVQPVDDDGDSAELDSALFGSMMVRALWAC